MARSERLFDLLQILRRHRNPVRGRTLADETGVSLRTLYRDIVSLQALGADIRGAPGLGYVLRPGFLLPPLMFTAEEIEALVLGSRWVAERADDRLRDAARSAMRRIAAVLPDARRDDIETSPLLIGPGATIPADHVDLTVLREAVRTERKITLTHRDKVGRTSDGIVWPFALAYFESVRVLIGWCELREGFRHFRTDRIVSTGLMEDRYPRRRHALLKEWRIAEGRPPSGD